MKGSLDMDESPQASMKQCTKCEQSFPATPEFFPRDKNRKDGLYPICKTCRKQYYQSHKAEISEKHKVYWKHYYETHKDQISEQGKRYYQANKERIRKHQIHYEEANRDKIRARHERYKVTRKEFERARQLQRSQTEEYKAYQKHYHQAHQEQEIEYARQYRKVHGKQLNEKKRNYLQTEKGRMVGRVHRERRIAQRKNAEGKYTARQIQELLKRQRYRCYYAACGFAKFQKVRGHYVFHIEHTIPLSRTEAQPRNDLSYIVLACPACNLQKGDKLPHEWYEGGRLL